MSADDFILVRLNIKVFLQCLRIVSIILLISVSVIKLIARARLVVNVTISVKSSLFKNTISGRVFDYLLPLVTNLLVLNLREAVLNGLHEVFFLATFGEFESFLNHKVAIVVAHQCVKALRVPYLIDKA